MMKQTLLAAAGLLLPLSLQAQFSQPVRDVENPAQNVFVATGFRQIDGGIVNALMELPDLPQGKRLTVEALTIRCRAISTVEITEASITTLVRRPNSTSYSTATFYIPMVKQGTNSFGNSTWVGALTGRVFTDHLVNANQNAAVQVIRSPLQTEMSCNYSLHGGLTNMPLQ